MRCLLGVTRVAVFVISSLTFAETIEPTTGIVSPTLSVTKNTDTGDVILSWTATTGPYAPIRDDDPIFFGLGPTILTAGLLSTTYADSVLNDGQTYFYLVRDGNSPPEVFARDTDGGAPGDSITLTGLGFASIPGDNQVFLVGGVEALVTATTPTSLTFTVPEQGEAGQSIVVTPRGASLGGEYYPIATTGLENISALAVDFAQNLFVSDRGTSSTADRVYLVNPSTQNRTQVGFLGEPTGLPVDASNRVYYGNSTINPVNQGTIERTTAAGAEELFRACGVASTDPCYVFGIGIDTDLTDFGSQGRIYVADGAQGRVRIVPPGGTIQNFLTGLSFGTAPRGVAVSLSPSSAIYHDVFVAESSRVRQYDSATIPGTLVATFDATNSDILSPRQVAITSTPRERVLVADDEQDRIVMLNPATGANKKISIPVTNPRAVALGSMASKTVAWVGEQTRIVRLPIHKTVYLSVWIARGSGISVEEVRHQVERANRVVGDCGYELQIRDDTVSFFDAGSLLDLEVWNKGATGGCGDPAFQPSQQELTLVSNMTRRSPIMTDLNIYYVRKFTQNGANPRRVGEALTGDCFVGLNDATQSGVIISVEALATNSLGQDVRTQTIWTLAHEIGHALMDRTAWTPGLDEHLGSDGLPLPANNVMTPPAALSHMLLNDPEQCTNINTDTTLFRGDP